MDPRSIEERSEIAFFTTVHGSMRTPPMPSGGMAFRPKPRDWRIKINQKEKRLAISTAMSTAAVNTIVVEDFGDKFKTPKTNDFIAAMKRWVIDPKEKLMFLMTEVSDTLRFSSRNIGTLKMLTPRTLNLYDILNSDKLVLTPAAVDYLNSRYGVNAYEGEDEEDYEGEEGQGGTEADTNSDATE